MNPRHRWRPGAPSRYRVACVVSGLSIVLLLVSACSPTTATASANRQLAPIGSEPTTTESAPAPGPSATDAVEWSVGGATWQVDVMGLVDVGPSLAADDPSYPELGRCVVLLGTLELTALTGALSPGREEVPSFYLHDGVNSVPAGFADCFRDEVKEAGYQWINDAQNVSEGSLYPFHAHFLVPPETEITQLYLGIPMAPGALAYPFEVTDAIPTAPAAIVTEPNVELLPLTGARIEQAAAPAAQTRWTTDVFGVIEQTANNGDLCYLIVGTVRADEVRGGPISSGAPQFEFARGQERSRLRFTGCSFSEAAQMGYDWILNAEMLEGATYPFMTTMTLPPGNDPDFLVLRFPETNEEHYLRFETIPAVPAVPALPDWTPPSLDLVPLSGATFSEFSVDTWQVQLNGALSVPGRGWFDVPGTCVLLYGTMTATQTQKPDASLLYRPSYFAIAGGVRWLAGGFEECGAHDLEAAGYLPSYDFDAALGEPFAFYEVLWVPEGYDLDAIVHDLDAELLFRPDLSDEITPP